MIPGTNATAAGEASRPTVLKLGGSLLDLPGLRDKLRAVLAAFPRPALLVGGGGTTDVVRAMDKCHGLGEETSHWLATRGLTLNGHIVAALLGESVVVADRAAMSAAWAIGKTPVLDALAFLEEDERTSIAPLPHTWSATSDSVGARIARLLGADTYVLIKSTPLPTGVDAAEAARRGIVDEWFPNEAVHLRRIVVVNLRADPWSTQEMETGMKDEGGRMNRKADG
jgi:aspartokinase-like uncharacterized kinase